MLDQEIRAKLINLAMQAEAEDYNPYFMRGLIIELNNLQQELKTSDIALFLRLASACTFKLFCELMYLKDIPVNKQAISYKL